ncbi:MAG: AMP-binding protein [Nocardioides sp.]|nr:AMP-binding protein [Nocardioides sp.]
MRRPSSHSLLHWARHLGVPVDDLDPTQLREDLSAGTIPQALGRAAEQHGDSTLTVDDERCTLAALELDVRRRAGTLAGMSIGKGQRVVIHAPSSLSMVTSYLAVLATGATAVLTNPGYTEGELAATVHRAGATLVLGDAPAASSSSSAATLTLVDLANQSIDAPPLEDPGTTPEDVALLAFTSGTTGEPKGVPLTHAHLLASIRGAMWSWRWSPSDVLVHALPLFHQHGLSGLHATLVAGSSASIISRFDAEALLTRIDEAGGTIMFGVPATHRRFLELPTDRLEPLRRLRLVTSGSGPLSPALAQAFRSTTGVTLLERYGLTESGLDVSNTYDGDRPPGRVGTSLPGVEVELRESDGSPTPLGQSGEIVLHGPQIFEGYLNNPEATEESFWPGGWFRTGDLGRWDDEDRLEITGRLKDLVITGGMNVSPVEVESVIEQLPEAREAAVAGLPSERWGEEVAAWVVPEGDSKLDTDRIVAYCREHLAAYKCPKHVFRIDALPRNHMGKVVRGDLTAPDGSTDAGTEARE